MGARGCEDMMVELRCNVAVQSFEGISSNTSPLSFLHPGHSRFNAALSTTSFWASPSLNLDNPSFSDILMKSNETPSRQSVVASLVSLVCAGNRHFRTPFEGTEERTAFRTLTPELKVQP